MKVLLLTLAIVDDIGAIIVIAVFYTDQVEFRFVLVAVAVSAAVAVMHRARIVYPPLFVIAGFALWFAVFESGIHATIAGVVMGLLTPARPIQTELEAEELVNVLENDDDIRADEVRATATLIRGSVSACDRMIESLHPWTSYVVVPVFALANAGIVLSSDALGSPSSVLTGVAVALVVGKLVGVTLFSWAAVRLRFARPPRRGSLGTHRRRWRGRRDRVHRLVVHHRPRLRGPSPPGRREDRHARRFDLRGDRRRCRADSGRSNGGPRTGPRNRRDRARCWRCPRCRSVEQ